MRHSGNYIHIQTKKDDKYEGLFSKSQERDLNGGITDIKTDKTTKEELEKRRKEQLIRGTGVNIHDPHGFG